MNSISADNKLINTICKTENTDPTNSFIPTGLNPVADDMNFLTRTISAVENNSVEKMYASEFKRKLKNNTLPNHLINVKGFLSYKNDSIQLPSVIQATMVRISNWHDKQTLPSKITTKTSKFYRCSVDEIGIINTKNLYLYSMTKLTKISSGSTVIKDLKIDNCPKLLNFPQDFSVGNLSIIGSRPAKVTPLNIKIKDDGVMYIENCKNITFTEISKKLGNVDLYEVDQEVVNQLKGVVIKKNVCIRYCPGVTTLPSGMKIGGNLELFYCNDFKIFPDDIIVEGKIKIYNCNQLREIPEKWFQNLPMTASGFPVRITFRDTDISQEQIIRYNKLAKNKAIFNEIYILYKKKSISLEKMINLWLEEADTNIPIPIISVLNDIQKQDLYLFLCELESVLYFDMFQSSVSKQIHKILKILSDDNIELKDRVLAQLSEANSSCSGRTTLYLSKLLILQFLVDAEKASRADDFTGEQLRIAAKHCFYMEEIELYAVAQAKLKRIPKEIEFFSAFLGKLAPRFNLPIPEGNIVILDKYDITNKSYIEQAEKIIREKVTNEFEQRLAEWEPWQQHLRFQQIKDKKYTDLPIDPINKQQEYEYAIICETDFNDHVVYDQRIYSYNELIKCYVTNGTDPYTKIPIELAKIYKIEIDDKCEPTAKKARLN